jgi:ABC-type branched-subunit amino acid transport system substrate-binding protein
MLRNQISNLIKAFIFIFSFSNAIAAELQIPVAVVLPLTGPAQTIGKSILAGTQACIEKANREGGVQGRSVRLLVEDDRFDQQTTVNKVGTLLARERPVALLNLIGAGNTKALVQSGLLDRETLPVLSMTSSTEVRQLAHSQLFFVRAGIDIEAELMVQQAFQMGFRRFALFVQDDESGRDGRQAMERALRAHGLQPVATGTHKKGSTSGIAESAAAIAAMLPEVILVHTIGPMAAKFRVESLRHGFGSVMIASSSSSAEQVIDTIGAEQAHGMAIVRVVPNPRHPLHPITHRFRRAMQDEMPEAGIDSFAFEGCVGAELLIAALRKAGSSELDKHPRKAVIAGLQRLSDKSVGGLDIRFSATTKQGLTYADIGVISRDGALRH